MQRAGPHVRVPQVYEVHDDAMVMEKIDGPTMDEDLSIRPWTIGAHASLLVSLHEQVARAGLVHFDINPTNVILSPDGPVLIDWTNAGEGDPAVDVALTYVILMTSGGLSGRALGCLFARRVDVETGLEHAASFRIADRNVTAAERARVERLLARRRPPRRGARRAGRNRGG